MFFSIAFAGNRNFIDIYVSILSLNKSLITRNIKLIPNEPRLLFTLEEENRSIFSINDARRILETPKIVLYTELLYYILNGGSFD